jgi:hypothetical protein
LSRTGAASPSAPASLSCDDRYTAEATGLIITAFLDAYNAGAPDITDRFLAAAGEFQWHGAPGRQYPDDPASKDRGTLPAYFAARHAKGDRLELKNFNYVGVKSGVVNFGYTLTHTVAGGTAREAPGKGALSCASGKIMVWRISTW